jgi:hypothetical protein
VLYLQCPSFIDSPKDERTKNEQQSVVFLFLPPILVDLTNCSTMSCHMMSSPNALVEMVTAPRVRWDAVLQRLENHPEEARIQRPIQPGEEVSGGRIGHDCPCASRSTVLHLALSRPYDSYYPATGVVEALVRACPEAAWIGISVDESPLHAACRRRATLGTLRVLMDARQSVPRHDSRALLAFWGSCSDLFGGDSELVRFCQEAHDREASSVLVRLYHLLRYCTDPPNAIESFSTSVSPALEARIRHVLPDGPSEHTIDSREGSTQLDARNQSGVQARQHFCGLHDDGKWEEANLVESSGGQTRSNHEASPRAVPPGPLLLPATNREWHAVNAAASLPFAPVGMLDLFLGESPLVARLDGNGWSALHHAAAIGNAELGDVGQNTHGGVADDTAIDELPCVGKVRRLIYREPRLCRLSDRVSMRLPIHIAAAVGLPFVALELLYREWPSALLRRDGREGLYPALLAAASSGDVTSLDCVYQLLLASPQVLHLRRRTY